ncbi:U3 snoRNP protein [Neophaeococcomyces mojaviensis]|uniref:U3 snoRNP protein n=1 Tax=Neophaeococcomyces mojaviensis TaxID=3383035 RepID=A0ACC3ACI9_9EURO|nr:U3 snoRNP protein [Knufia sp. JES_112]
MTATADKARYFLEQSVPELKEFERKKIFSPEEITSIAKKRSDFEHQINARGSSPTDYAQYAEFEINVDLLRRKRVKRLGIRATAHSGQRRIFFVFDRGVRKFPGDVKLWMQAIEYARSQKALKKGTQMLTNVLRLHPTKAELWIYAAQYALEENGDMTEARAYIQRGLRFCKNSKQMWLQDFRLEMSWIAKIVARRRILGMEKEKQKEEETKIVGEDDNVMMLPKLTAQDIAPEEEQEDKVDVTALENLEATPIMSGAIPIAVFDAAMTQFDHNPELARQFFEEASAFGPLPMLGNILAHVDTLLQQSTPGDWNAMACNIALPTSTILPDDPEFPAALRQSLSRMNQALARTEQREALVGWCRKYLEALLQQDPDPALQQVLQSRVQALSG